MFLNEFLSTAGLPLTASDISEEALKELVFSSETKLNWRGYLNHYDHDDSFHLALRIDSDENMPGGAILGIYNAANGVLNIYLLESLVIQKQEHPLRGRLTALMIVAVSYFLSYFDDSQGILLCEPSPNLEDYYRSFGFEYVNNEDKMFASIERLNEMQTRLNEAIGP